MKCIVVFGAGKSSSVLIDYLKALSVEKEWKVFIADHDYNAAQQKTGMHPFVQPVQVNVYDEEERSSFIQKADVVISLLPPALHILVAESCLSFSKHLLTASYIDDRIQHLSSEIKSKNLLFLCEMGLDPGIDHMSAMNLIHQIEAEGGIITSFISHCGGLVAPDSDTNPWHYKISWNPRNIVMAGKAGAVYKQNNKKVFVDYTDVFTQPAQVSIPGLGEYAWYPNRDSVSYATLYGLDTAQTFIRTTLRHPQFCFGWQAIVDLGLTNETHFYGAQNLSIASFFTEYIGKLYTENLLTNKLIKCLYHIGLLPQSVMEVGDEVLDSASTISDADLALFEAQFSFLGVKDNTTIINNGTCSIAQILQWILERKLALEERDKDMVVMLHEIEYTLHNTAKKRSSYLVVEGENNIHTAMAKTVGLPLGIAAKLLLEDKIGERGLHIPVTAAIYKPVLEELALHGISFTEF